MKKIKLTCAHAIVKHLIAQKILIDGKKVPLFAGAFGIFGHGNVACLGQALEEFANRNINLTKIQSRPTREKAWDYNFFVDFEGHIEDNYCKELYDSLAEMCKFVKVLGSYPRA